MLPTTFATPSRLAIFALEQGSGLPIARMPTYAEVIVRSQEAEPPVDPFQGLDPGGCPSRRTGFWSPIGNKLIVATATKRQLLRRALNVDPAFKVQRAPRVRLP